MGSRRRLQLRNRGVGAVPASFRCTGQIAAVVGKVDDNLFWNPSRRDDSSARGGGGVVRKIDKIPRGMDVPRMVLVVRLPLAQTGRATFRAPSGSSLEMTAPCPSKTRISSTKSTFPERSEGMRRFSFERTKSPKEQSLRTVGPINMWSIISLSTRSRNVLLVARKESRVSYGACKRITSTMCGKNSESRQRAL